MSNAIKLQIQSILQVPISSYEKDFIFIVNGKEIKTSKIIADLLSPKISKARINDPTIREFVINTHSQGNFEQILNLVNFERQEISNNNESFFSEVIDQLGITSIDIDISDDEITLDNVIERVKSHEHKIIYSELYSKEIDFLSANFSKAVRDKKTEMLSLSKFSLENILKNDKLRVSNEDEVVLFINELFVREGQFSSLYEYVYFENVESSTMKSFIDVFDINEMTCKIWNSLSLRLMQEVKKTSNEKNKRYKIENVKLNDERSKPSHGQEILYSSYKEFEGIINFLKKTSNIKDEINITYSSDNNSGFNDIFNLVGYENPSKHFCTKNENNSWICFEFKNHRIIPINYTIRSNNGGKGNYHLKNWVIEGSMDSVNWEHLSEERYSTVLDGKSIVHTFSISNEKRKEIKFIRIRQTGQNSYPNINYHLFFSAFEIYGQLI